MAKKLSIPGGVPHIYIYICEFALGFLENHQTRGTSVSISEFGGLHGVEDVR